MPDTEEKARNVLITEGRLLLGVFVTGVVLVLWLVNNVITPLAAVKSDVINLRDNHIHTIEIKMDTLQTTVTDLGKAVAKLQQILEDRLPNN